MAPAGGILAPITMRVLRHGFTKTLHLIKARIAQVSRPVNSELQPVLARQTPTHAIPRAALLRQSKGRWYTTHSTINAAVRRFMSSGDAIRHNRTAFPKSATATAVSRLTTRSPFASTLRPNLTGGAIPRTSGGYNLGGGRINGARYFSHTPAAPAQVLQNVSTFVRAFWLSGHKAQFDGMTARGEKRFRTVSDLQDEITRNMKTLSRKAAGSYVEFQLSPLITAITPLGAFFPLNNAGEQAPASLSTPGFLDVLSVDLARAVEDLVITLNDLKHLSTLGDLPVTSGKGSSIRVHFPGCDAETVEHLCDEVGVRRGTVHQDADFEDCVGGQVALMFPFAPTREHTISANYGSQRSVKGHDFQDIEGSSEEDLWVEGYETMDESSETESIYFSRPSDRPSSSDYEGVEGLYRFLEECDNARRVR